MRVITGSAKGRKLTTLEGMATRPTSERSKEGIFSALQFEIEGRRVLDLFAGSGQLGIEALSRGAAFCVFVDASQEACDIVKENLRSTRLSSQGRVIRSDALAFLQSPGDPYDIAFLDPPYAAGLLPAALEGCAARMRESGVIVCESDEGTPLPENVGGFRIDREYRHGRVHLTFYRKEVSL